jgi:hypothetical protein
MQVGISSGYLELTAADVRGMREIGAQCVKVPCYLDAEAHLLELPYALEAIHEVGAMPIVDLRIDPVTIREAARVATGQGKPAYAEVYADLSAVVRRVVGAYADVCRDWEWWGEAHCPVVTGGKFGTWEYAESLKIVHAAAHEADRACRVWSGGFGMNLGMSAHPAGVKFLRRLVEAGAGRAFDICNLHPYAHGRNLTVTLDWHAGQLDEMRAILNHECAGQPFASSEFGYPTVPRNPRYLKSSRMDLGHGVQALTEAEAPMWFDETLHLFERAGFRSVCIHKLDDGPGAHWGEYCGLRRRGVFGRIVRKPQWHVVRRWAE